MVCRYCWILFAPPQMQQIVSTVSFIWFHCSMYFWSECFTQFLWQLMLPTCFSTLGYLHLLLSVTALVLDIVWHLILSCNSFQKQYIICKLNVFFHCNTRYSERSPPALCCLKKKFFLQTILIQVFLWPDVAKCPFSGNWMWPNWLHRVLAVLFLHFCWWNYSIVINSKPICHRAMIAQTWLL